jgi:uncharacterized membrane protein YqjE
LDASGTTQTNYPPSGNGNDPDDQTLGQLVNQISENASTLIREEIELAKAEVEQKVKRLAMGGVVAGVAGFFVLIGLIFVFQTIAWGISDAFFPNDIWAGFLITTVLLFLLAALGGFIAYRSFQAGAPPIPDQAIEEAKLIREALEHPDVQAAAEAEAASAPQSAPEPQAAAEPQAAPVPAPEAVPAAAAEPGPAPADDKAEEKKAKQAAKDAKRAEKQAEKDRKEAAKQAEKAKKEAEKQAEKAKKEAEKQAEKAKKEAEKQAKKEAKDAKDGED